MVYHISFVHGILQSWPFTETTKISSMTIITSTKSYNIQFGFWSTDCMSFYNQKDRGSLKSILFHLSLRCECRRSTFGSALWIRVQTAYNNKSIIDREGEVITLKWSKSTGCFFMLPCILFNHSQTTVVRSSWGGGGEVRGRKGC